ncbi:MAG: amidohydrolase family protein [Pirellulaceae bacterium]
MNFAFSRRRFLVGATAAYGIASAPAIAAGPGSSDGGKMLDIHVHLFGTGDADSGCRLSKATTEGRLFKLLAAQLRLGERAKTTDEGYVLALAEQVETSGMEKAVILAQDAVYDRRGKPDWDNTHFYVPNDYLMQVVARYPARMIPCVSINPERADALTELDRCAAQGVTLLKIHPPTQGVDLADQKHTAFFRRCADLKIIVMVHTGHEHSAPVVNMALADPRKLELALDSGCTVVACHCGTGWPQDHPDMLPDFLSMGRRFKNLWGDTAVLGSAGRVGDFRRLLAHREAIARLLHGSDFPFPATPLAFAGVIGLEKAITLQAMTNSMEQDLALKDALGIGRTSAERAYALICGATSQ